MDDADAGRRTGGGGGSRSQVAPTRLQRRAPASIEISRPSNWNVAIPLLSPLVSPSNCLKQEDVLVGEKKTREEARGKPPTFTKWHHPAAPFYYGPVPRATPFVPV